MTEASDFISRTKTLGGRRLRDALDAARGEVIGGPGIKVNSVGGKTVVSLKGQRIVRRGGPFPVFLNPPVDPVAPDPVEFMTNRWDYAWAEAELDSDNEWVLKEPGRRWDDAGSKEARNTTEHGNTDIFVQHSIILDQSSGDPAFTLTIEPLPNETMVWVREVKDEGGVNTYWFTAYNQLKVTCGTVPEPVLPPPPTIDTRVIA